MSQERPDPTAIMRLTTGYWGSAALLAANDLGMFGALGNDSRTAQEVAGTLGLSTRGAEMLLDACVGLGLMAKEGEAEARYRNTAEAAAFLVPGSPAYLGDAIRWAQDQYAAWGNLTEAVRQGRPAVAPEQHLGDDPEQTRRFVLGMHRRALGVAQGLLHFLDLTDVGELLDIGGGPGTYATLLARKYPDLRVTVLDLPGIVAIAEELIAQAGLSGRVTTRPGNAVTDDYGEDCADAVLFSGVLHQMSPPTIAAMLAKARRALRPGGKLLISDIMLDSAQPAFATLFSLQMLLTTQEGAVFSASSCQQWLEEAGFSEIAVLVLPPPLPYAVVSARA